MKIYKKIPLNAIDDSPWQGRIIGVDLLPNPEDNVFEEKAMQQLVSSIQQNGLMQPITVRPSGAIQDRYELIDGHRRMLAFRRLGLTEIDALVEQYDDRQAQILSVVGNLQRKNLKTIELALAFQKILDSGLFADKRELSNAIGKDETYVGDILNTLNMSPRVVEDLAQTNAVKDVRLLRTIRNAAPADTPEGEEKQWQMYRMAVDENLNRTELGKRLAKAHSFPKQKPAWQITPNKTHVMIKLKTGKISEQRLQELQQLIDKKLAEIMNEMG
jgi:ParB family chromosome partitioning protein